LAHFSSPLPYSQQKKEALTNENLPEEYRMALAKALQDDLFFKVYAALECAGYIIAFHLLTAPLSHV
jgi:hypothetical protein